MKPSIHLHNKLFCREHGALFFPPFLFISVGLIEGEHDINMFGFKVKQGAEAAYGNAAHASHQEHNEEAKGLNEMLSS